MHHHPVPHGHRVGCNVYDIHLFQHFERRASMVVIQALSSNNREYRRSNMGTALRIQLIRPDSGTRGHYIYRTTACPRVRLWPRDCNLSVGSHLLTPGSWLIDGTIKKILMILALNFESSIRVSHWHELRRLEDAKWDYFHEYGADIWMAYNFVDKSIQRERGLGL